MNKEAYFEQLVKKEASTKERLLYKGIYLFSEKGFSNVGIRELCREVGIKESSFYNHYQGKHALFDRILCLFTDMSQKVIYSDEEIEAIVATGDVHKFLIDNMMKFTQSTNSLLYHTILQIIFMECYTNPSAYAIAKNNLYYLRKEYTEKVLSKMMVNGDIINCDVEQVTMEYYYGLKGLLDEYLLRAVWGDEVEPIMVKIKSHLAFYGNMLDGRSADKGVGE